MRSIGDCRVAIVLAGIYDVGLGKASAPGNSARPRKAGESLPVFGVARSAGWGDTGKAVPWNESHPTSFRSASLPSSGRRREG